MTTLVVVVVLIGLATGASAIARRLTTRALTRRPETGRALIKVGAGLTIVGWLVLLGCIRLIELAYQSPAYQEYTQGEPIDESIVLIPWAGFTAGVVVAWAGFVTFTTALDTEAKRGSA